MSKKLNIHILTCILILSFSIMLSAQEIWPGLEKGKYDVGYSIEQLYDASRNFKLTDSSPVIQRPMQISIWYPAEKGPLESFRLYQEYFWDHVSRYDFKATSLEVRNREMNEFFEYIKNNEGNLDKAKRIFASTTIAINDADHAAGRFPLIIYSPGRNSSAVNNSQLCEYLASHGFVVAAVSSTGADKPDVGRDASAFNGLLEDLAFVKEHMSLKNYVDKNKVGLIGHSFGGMSITLYALKEDVDAVVNLDGSNFAPGWQSLFYSFPQSKSPEMKAAYLHLMSDPPADSGFEHETRFFKQLKNNAILAKIKGFGHGDYLGMIAAIYLKAEMKPSMFASDDMSFIGPGYANCSKAILAFLNEHIKGITPGKDVFLVNTDKYNSLDKGDLVILQRK
jgi:dienelactone hydrolase